MSVRVRVVVRGEWVLSGASGGVHGCRFFSWRVIEWGLEKVGLFFVCGRVHLFRV